MSVHYLFLAFALLLLWFPRGWLRHGLRVTPKPARRFNQAKTERDPHERGVKPLEEAVKSRNWVDLLRAAVGAYGVTSAAFHPPAGFQGAHTPTLIWQGSLLALAVLFQMVRLEGRLSLFAPIFFLQGMTFGVAGMLVGLLAMVGSWALTPMLPGPGAVLFVQGGITLSLGLLLQDTEPKLLMVLTGVIWLPVLTSVLLRKRLSASFDKRMKVVSRGEWTDRDDADPTTDDSPPGT